MDINYTNKDNIAIFVEDNIELINAKITLLLYTFFMVTIVSSPPNKNT